VLNGHTNLEISSGAGSITITAARTITIDAGGSTISIGPSGITISTGGNITLEGATIKNNC
jgi:type VI secretion system secreted protein VgrG